MKSKGPICLVDSPLDVSANVICGAAQAAMEKAAGSADQGAFPGPRGLAHSPIVPPPLLMLGDLLRKLPYTCQGLQINGAR